MTSCIQETGCTAATDAAAAGGGGKTLPPSPYTQALTEV